jgi:hypothetical protein
MWPENLTTTELFDASHGCLPDRLAQSALSWDLSWTGLPHHPPLEAQPGVCAWGEAHLLWAYILQYEATGDLKYLHTLVTRFDRMLGLRDNRNGRLDVKRGRVMPAWGSVLFSAGQYTAFLCHAGNIIFPAACFVRLVYADPALGTEFGATARRYEQSLRETIDAYDNEWHDGPDPMEGYFTDVSLWDKNLPLNQQNLLGRAMLELGVATQDSRYLDRVRRLAVFLKRRMKHGPTGAYVWPYYAPLETPDDFTEGEDISHAAVNADFAWMCNRHGIVFDQEDMQRLARTLLDVVHRPLADVGGDWADLVCGQGAGANGVVACYWGRLATHRPEVTTALRRYYFTRQPPITGPLAMLSLAMIGWAENAGAQV